MNISCLVRGRLNLSTTRIYRINLETWILPKRTSISSLDTEFVDSMIRDEAWDVISQEGETLESTNRHDGDVTLSKYCVSAMVSYCVCHSGVHNQSITSPSLSRNEG